MAWTWLPTVNLLTPHIIGLGLDEFEGRCLKSMKRIAAVVRPEKLEPLKEALFAGEDFRHDHLSSATAAATSMAGKSISAAAKCS